MGVILVDRQELFYPMIFKRKSFHLFKEIGQISAEELSDIQEAYKTFIPLVGEIRTGIRIVPGDQTTCKRGQEYCILLYSEKKEHYLQNIGYLGEQLDLYLASNNIGALWFGIGKTEQKSYDGMDFVIMIAIAKMPADKFRKDMFKSKRKPLAEIWQEDGVWEMCGSERGREERDGGKAYGQLIGNIVRFAPSACNTQPWIAKAEAGKLSVCRYKKPGKRGIMPADKVVYYNRIDIGIFLLFLELCFAHEGISFERKLFADAADEAEMVLTAEYHITSI